MAPKNLVNFGDPGMYVAGGGIPEGNYALEFLIQNYQAQKADGTSSGPERLGVMITAHSLTDAEKRGDGAYKQFYSMGRNAHLSYQPDPDTGKSLVSVAGGPATTLPNSTNWAVFLKEMFNSGLPAGIFTNDISVLDGMHAHLHPIPEPEERKSFQSATSEGSDEPRKNNTICVVGEILEDGKPWEGTGGIPDTNTKAATKPNGKVATVKAAPKVTAAKPKPAAEEEADPDDMEAVAKVSASKWFSEKPNGGPKLLFKTGVLKLVGEKYGEEVKDAIKDGLFDSDDNINAVISGLGYNCANGQVKPA